VSLQTPGSASAAGEQLAEADGVGLEQARAARLLGVPRLAPSRHVRQGRQSDMLSTACRHSELIPGGAAVPCASAITSASARASADAKNNRSAAIEVESLLRLVWYTLVFLVLAARWQQLPFCCCVCVVPSCTCGRCNLSLANYRLTVLVLVSFCKIFLKN
jgi:hypothetical protein